MNLTGLETGEKFNEIVCIVGCSAQPPARSPFRSRPLGLTPTGRPTIHLFIILTYPMKKLPAMQFYIGDWRKDPGIQSLDYFSRGVWFEILLFMHESETRGLLLLNDKPPTPEQLAQMLGISPSKTKQTQAKLLANGVASIEQNSGALMCRKMFKLHEVRVKAGHIGGSKSQAKRKQTLKQSGKPSFSTSFSISKQKALAESDFLTKIKQNQAYKHLNIDHELGQMDAWILTHPGRKKTKSFVVNWLNRSADRKAVVQTPVVDKPIRMRGCFICGGGKMIPEDSWARHLAEHNKEREQHGFVQRT
jgi:hypothetical protein